MSHEVWQETFEEQKVTYVLEQQGKVLIIEHVPARVCRETGERLFARNRVTLATNCLGAKKANPHH